MCHGCALGNTSVMLGPVTWAKKAAVED
jgi:hypothetical protein